MVDNSNQDVEPPWKRADSGSVWCPYQNLPDDIRLRLKLENGCKETIDENSYYVKRYENGSDIVFRNPPGNNRYGSTRTSVDGLYTEFQVLPLEEANKLLATSNEFEPIGTDPVKVIGQQFFVVLGKKEKVG
jgi:hypothetical protein